MSGRSSDLSHLAATISLYALFLAGWAVLCALRGRPRGPAHGAGLALLELALLFGAVLHLVALAGGHRPAEPATAAGYLIASVLILPVAWSGAREPGSGWDGAVLAIACLALAVVSLRLRSVWATA